MIGILGGSAARIAQEGLVGGGILRSAVGDQEGARFSGAEGVAGRGIGKTFLFGVAKDAQFQGRRK